jgi:hypothetical protein
MSCRFCCIRALCQTSCTSLQSREFESKWRWKSSTQITRIRQKISLDAQARASALKDTVATQIPKFLVPILPTTGQTSSISQNRHKRHCSEAKASKAREKKVPAKGHSLSLISERPPSTSNFTAAGDGCFHATDDGAAPCVDDLPESFWTKQSANGRAAN